MESAKSIVLLAVLSVLAASCAHWRKTPNARIVGAAADEREVAASRYASSLVKITTDAAILPLDSWGVELLLRSDEVGGRAAHDVLGVGRTEGLEFIHLEVLQNICTAKTARQQGEPGPLPTPEPTEDQSQQGSSFAGYGMGDYGNYPDFWHRSYVDYGYYRPQEEVVFSCPAADKEPSIPIERTIFLHVEVDLPEGVKPAARQFLDALIEYLRDALYSIYANHTEEIEQQLESAQTSRDQAEAELSDAIKQGTPHGYTPKIGLDPANEAVYRQLDETVDISALTPTMPFSAAVDNISNAVDPPLKIVVLWRDLYDNAEVEPTTEINMDGHPAIPLRIGLDKLLKAVTGGLGEEIGYVVESGVITIATRLSLPAKLETRVYHIPAVIRAAGKSQRLADVLMQVVEPDSWFELNEEMGEGEIVSYLDTKLVILQTPQNHTKIQKVLEEMVAGVPVPMGRDIPTDVLTERIRSLQDDKDRLDKQLTALNGRLLESGEKKDREDAACKARVRESVESETSPVIAALEIPKDRVEGESDEAELEQVKYIIEKMRAAPEKLIKAIDESHRGYDAYNQSEEEVEIWSQRSSIKNELSTANSRIAQIESLLTATKVIDPEVSQIRLAARRLESTDGRVHELKSRLANLQPPRVTIVGAH